MALHPSDLEGRIAGQPKPIRVLVPLLLGVAIALGHESWLATNATVLIGLVLAFLLVPAAQGRAGWYGWLIGVGYFAFTLRWIIEPFLVDPVRHGWMAPFAIIGLAGGLALFWAAAFWLARRFAGASPMAMIWAAVFLTAVELARGHVLSGFPWALVSYSLVGTVWDVWLAWVGPYGLNFLLFGVAAVTAYSLQRGWTLIWPALVGVLFATFGMQAVTPSAPAPLAEVVRVIQPNAPQHLKWDRDWMGVFFDRSIELTAAGEGADVVIWPETSVPTLVEYAQPAFERIAGAANGAAVVAGIQRREGDSYYNSAVVLDDDGAVADLYDKAHLVPFGEYVPLAWLLEPIGLGTLVDQVAGFSRGAPPELLEIEGLGRVRVLICYEGIFPEEIATGDGQADIVLILTNDAWFGAGPGPRQHLAQAQARAIEQGLPVIRSANTGISAVIDARGEIVAQLPLNEAGALDAAVPAPLPPTVYARTGDWPLVVLLLVCTLAGGALRRAIVVDGADPRR